MNVEYSPEAIEQQLPLLLKLKADSELLKKNPEIKGFEKEAYALKEKYGPEILKFLKDDKDAMALFAGSKKAVNFAKEKITPYGAMGLHIDNDKLPAAKELVMSMIGNGKKIEANKQFIDKLKSYTVKPDSLALGKKVKEFYGKNKTS